MANKRIVDLDNSNQLDTQDYLAVYNAEPTADALTYKATIADILALKSISVNGKTGSSITITPDDINDATSEKKFVNTSDKDKIALIKNDLGSDVFLAGDGTYRAMAGYSGGTTVVVVTADNNISTANQNMLLVVDTSSGAITITLPESPIDKQSVKVKDGGNAYTNPITIDGNGKQIEGDSTAIVETNYGALEVMFIEVLDKWVVTSFVN